MLPYRSGDGMETRKDEVGYGTVASWRISGPDPPLVCVHGAGVSSRQTLPLVEACSGRMSAWAVDRLADALLAWLQKKQLSRPCLLGAPLGTQVVAEAAELREGAEGIALRT